MGQESLLGELENTDAELWGGCARELAEEIADALKLMNTVYVEHEDRNGGAR